MDVTFHAGAGTISVMNLLTNSVKRLLQRPATPGVADGELLARFVAARDQAAFELLVHRHGPMVLGLCRRLIGDAHEAEDAFQATFLTLACRARSIRQGQSLGSWLYKVTFRMCQRLRQRAGRRDVLFALPDNCIASTEEQVQRREEVELLAREVDRLSESLRSAVVLCYLQGMSSVEAARELGCPPNTVSIRLRRARERLKRRLASRGVALSSGVALTLGSTAHAGVVPIAATHLAGQAVRLAAGATAAGVVSLPVATLLKGALVVMWWKPLKLAALAVLAVGLVAAPVWNASSSALAQDPWARSTIPGRVERVGVAQDNVLRFVEQDLLRPAYPSRVEAPPTLFPSDPNMPEEAVKWIAAQSKQEDAIRKEAEQKIRKLRMQLYTKLRGLQDQYTKAGDLDRAVAVRDQARRLEASIVNARPDPGTLTHYRSKVGESFVFHVTGRTDATIWGDGIYTDDSALATVAVHAGLVRPGQPGVVKVTVLEGKPSYQGADRHGVKSLEYGSFAGSYRVERVDPIAIAHGEMEQSQRDLPLIDPTTFDAEKEARVLEVLPNASVRLSAQRLQLGDVVDLYRYHEGVGQRVGNVEVTQVNLVDAVAKIRRTIAGQQIKAGDVVRFRRSNDPE